MAGEFLKVTCRRQAEKFNQQYLDRVEIANGFANRFLWFCSADGTRIFFNDDGILGYIVTASGSVTIPTNNYGEFAANDYEMQMSATQTRLIADGFIDALYLYGAAFSADGTLLFQPNSQAIDVFDGVTGVFRGRVALPVALSPNFRALVSDGKDNRIIAITGSTGNGIAVVDLSSLPEPAAVSWLSAHPAPARMNNRLPSLTAKQRSLATPFQRIHRSSSPLLRGLAALRR